MFIFKEAVRDEAEMNVLEGPFRLLLTNKASDVSENKNTFGTKNGKSYRTPKSIGVNTGVLGSQSPDFEVDRGREISIKHYHVLYCTGI